MVHPNRLPRGEPPPGPLLLKADGLPNNLCLLLQPLDYGSLKKCYDTALAVANVRRSWAMFTRPLFRLLLSFFVAVTNKKREALCALLLGGKGVIDWIAPDRKIF